jgi:hypothetical protein
MVIFLLGVGSTDFGFLTADDLLQILLGEEIF